MKWGRIQIINTKYFYLNRNIMKSFKYTIIPFLGFLLFSFSCKNNEKKEEELSTIQANKVTKATCSNHILKNKQNNLNISILLDLSDRIDEQKYPNPTMEYFKRDLEYINTIATSFSHHVQQKKLVLVHDKIQIYLEPEPSDFTINKKSQELKTIFTRELTKESLENTSKNYKKMPEEIYSLAKKEEKYLGSDTWRFFKDKVKRYCVDTCNRNILIILTDGYMYHEHTKIKEQNKRSYVTPSVLRNLGLNKSNWVQKMNEKNIGFIPATSALNDLEVLVLGIENHDKKRNPYGKEVLEKLWANWFKEMGVKRFEIYGADLPTHMEKTISNFILH